MNATDVGRHGHEWVELDGQARCGLCRVLKCDAREEHVRFVWDGLPLTANGYRLICEDCQRERCETCMGTGYAWRTSGPYDTDGELCGACKGSGVTEQEGCDVDLGA